MTPESHLKLRRFSWRRLKGLWRKEMLQVVRDPSSIAIAFVMPLILLLLFGYAVSLDAKDVPLALVVEEPSAVSAAFTAGFEASPYFESRRAATIQEAEEMMRLGQVEGIVWLKSDFDSKLFSGEQAPIAVITNGVDANTARIVEGYVQGAWQRWLEDYAQSQGRELALPVEVEERVWFNAEVRSRNFLVPGLIAVIMTLIGALLTAMVVAREWERGTMEALMVTPVTVREILLGKLVPYFILGMGGMALSVAMAVLFFEVPLRGSLWVLSGAAALFMFTALGMGLLISTLARNQFVAAQVAIITTFLPAFMLSGFIFNIGSMPEVVQFITRFIAARYFVSILQSVFLAGDVWSILWHNALALAVMGALFLLLVAKKTKKRLD
ncbi:membrane protein [Desulfocarbo indianensis]|nr:membrane protein [Desulfocarbo indianensis]